MRYLSICHYFYGRGSACNAMVHALFRWAVIRANSWGQCVLCSKWLFNVCYFVHHWMYPASNRYAVSAFRCGVEQHATWRTLFWCQGTAGWVCYLHSLWCSRVSASLQVSFSCSMNLLSAMVEHRRYIKAVGAMRVFSYFPLLAYGGELAWNVPDGSFVGSLGCHSRKQLKNLRFMPWVIL